MGIPKFTAAGFIFQDHRIHDIADFQVTQTIFKYLPKNWVPELDKIGSAAET